MKTREGEKEEPQRQREAMARAGTVPPPLPHGGLPSASS